MKKRFLTGRGLLAATVLAAGGGVLALWAGPAAALTPSSVVSHSGTAGAPTPGHPKLASKATVSPSYVAYTSFTGDEAVAAVTTADATAHVYLIAGPHANTGVPVGHNAYHILTAPSTYGSLVTGDIYALAGTGSVTMVADPGGGTTPGESSTATALANGISPVSLAFDKTHNLLIGESHPNTGPSRSGIQMVPRLTCASTCAYGYGAGSFPALVAGSLYTIAGVGSWTGITPTSHISYTFQVAGYGMAVDATGDVIVGAAGNVVFLNETASAISNRYGITSLAAHHATKIAGTATSGTATCGAGNHSVPALGASAPNLEVPRPAVDTHGNVFINDDSSTATYGCTWVLPVATGHVDGIAVTAGDLTSLTGGAGTTAATNGAVAATTSDPVTNSIAIDTGGNVVLGVSGTSPSVRVIAMTTTPSEYGMPMTRGHVYIIASGAPLVGAPRSATPPEYGIDSLAAGAPGNLYFTDGSTGTTGTLYKLSGGPTTPPGPKTTTVTLSETPSGSAYTTTPVILTATITPGTAVGQVKFYKTGVQTGSTKTVTGAGTVTEKTTVNLGTLAHANYHFIAKFTPSTATAFKPSTSATVTYAVKTSTTKVTGVRQHMKVTVQRGQLTLSCTHYVTTELTAIKTCPLITLPSITLNGTTQHSSHLMNPLYILTARGTPTSGWSLSAVMVPTTTTGHHPNASLPYNPDTTCASVQGFCDSSVGTHASTVTHGQIAATNLKLNGFGCAPAATNVNPTPSTTAGGTLKTPLTICSAAAGTSGGEFKVKTGTFTLTIPSTVFHGLYYGTVEYTLVSVA